MGAETDQSLEDVSAAVSFFVVTGEQPGSNITDPPLERRV